MKPWAVQHGRELRVLLLFVLHSNRPELFQNIAALCIDNSSGTAQWGAHTLCDFFKRDPKRYSFFFSRSLCLLTAIRTSCSLVILPVFSTLWPVVPASCLQRWGP